VALAVAIAILGLSLFNIPFTLQEPLDKENKELVTAELKAAAIDHPDLALGKNLFKNNCASCHNRNMKDNLVGPALSGVLERWAKYPKEDLYKWIRNSKQLIAEKHPEALVVWNKWNQSPMTSFPNLSDEEIEALLAYIER
jgi:mono/diheme cytochrome c family protein